MMFLSMKRTKNTEISIKCDISFHLSLLISVLTQNVLTHFETHGVKKAAAKKLRFCRRSRVLT